jgi:(2Fe-2S) ferredoxin
MQETHTIVVCDSHRPRIHGGGCCSDKGGESLRQAFEEKLAARGLLNQVVIRNTGCLKNCRAGISIRVLEDNITYGRVKAGDLDEIIESHLLQGQPVARLRVEDTPRFYSF